QHHQQRGVVRGHLRSVRAHVRLPPGQPRRVAGVPARGGGHRGAVHPGQAGHRAVPRPERHRVHVRRRGLARGGPHLGVLLGADPASRRRDVVRARDPGRKGHVVADGRSNRWIVAIGVFKLVKAALLVGLATGALALRSTGPLAPIHDLAGFFHLDPDNPIVAWLTARATGLSPHELVVISIATSIYAALFIVEGVGLVLRKRWGEIVTVIITGSLIPWEVYEAIRRASPAKFALIAGNVAIVAYLVGRLRGDARYK